MIHILFVSFKLLTERKRQTLVSILGVAIGVTAFVVMTSLMFGFQHYFVNQVIDLEPHISIKPKEDLRISRIVEGFVEVYGSKPKEEDRINGWFELMRELEGMQEVIGVAPHLVVRGVLKYGVKEKPVNIIGIDPEYERRATVVERFLENKRLHSLSTNKDGIILGKLVARDLGIEDLGKKVILVTPNGKTTLLRVQDFFNSGITNIDNSRVYVNIKTLQALTDRPNEVNEIVVRIKDVNKAESLARMIAKEVNYQVESWQRAYVNFLQIFKIQNLITYMIVFAILTVSAFGIFNIIMMSVLEKRRDIAILMAMGYSTKDITLIFLLVGTLIGIVGGLIGCLGGFLLQEYLSSVELEVEGLIRTKGFILDRDPMYFVYGFISSFIFSLLASLYPSYRASKVNPVDIFRSSG
ncbi:ABC transporter permease [Thermocrinis minervae]|uniref:Lipoprotein-releasing system permease protein n=1 Tax=Thermocrinis minervae TaxID=381751 RepID=A0A1M6RDD4_9AQUI|nr:ABC transporter permease [Thermocrinis minervae]SHK30453.1 lipoprotein-releasing system permease protein [Thermocrinis minervae]